MKLLKTIFFVSIFSSLVIQAQEKSETFAKVEDPLVQKRLINIKARFEQLSKDKIEEYQALKKKAIEANEKQKYFTALIASSDALEIFGDDIDLLWLKGVCFAQLNEKEKAVINYKKALDIHPNHAPSLLNIVEIYFYHGDYEEAVEYMVYIRKYLNSTGTAASPLFDFKYLIALTKLAEDQPEKYAADLEIMKNLHSYMDDNPYHYYVKALNALKLGNKDDGQVWIYKAVQVFQNPQMIKVWNKTLEDTGFLAAHDIVIGTKRVKK